MSISVSLPNERELKAKFSQINPTLCPKQLVQFFPEYKKFTRNRERFGIWQTFTFQEKIAQNKNQFSKLLLLLSGVAGGGKDALRETITKLYPSSIFKIITATSRAQRESEQQGIDYYFYEDKTQMRNEIKQGKFLETVAQGERLYGLPKISLIDALKRPESILVTHVEMTAWPKVAHFIQTEVEDKPFILKVFVIPQMKYKQYTTKWLRNQREDYAVRLSRTLWELDKAPQKADLLISNHIDKNIPFLQWQTDSLLKIIQEVLTPQAKTYFFSQE